MRLWRSSRSASLAATNSAAVPATIFARNRCIASAKMSASPQIRRASSKAVRTVMSDLASASSSPVERIEWPTFSFRSHSILSMASTSRSCCAVGLALVRNMRSTSLNGAISPAAGAAEPDDRHRRDVRVAGDKIVGEADDLVVEVGRGAGGGAAGVGLKAQATGDLCPALLQGGAQQLRRETVAIAAGRNRRKASAIDRRSMIVRLFSTLSKSARLIPVWRSTWL